jgi:FkbM family methyltransferase
MHYIFTQYINKDSIVLEGGCHIGSHTLKLAMLSKHVYGFEPMPKSYELLEKNIKINNLYNVTLYKKGLADTTSTVTFEWIPNDNPGGAGLSHNPMGKPEWIEPTEDTRDVELTTIDLLNLDKLDFIKLDVEGYEELVIKGGIQTIKKFKPIIALEAWCNHTGGVDINYTKNIFSNLLNIGYTLEHIEGPDFLFKPIP